MSSESDRGAPCGTRLRRRPDPSARSATRAAWARVIAGSGESTCADARRRRACRRARAARRRGTAPGDGIERHALQRASAIARPPQRGAEMIGRRTAAATWPPPAKCYGAGWSVRAGDSRDDRGAISVPRAPLDAAAAPTSCCRRARTAGEQLRGSPATPSVVVCPKTMPGLAASAPASSSIASVSLRAMSRGSAPMDGRCRHDLVHSRLSRRLAEVGAVCVRRGNRGERRCPSACEYRWSSPPRRRRPRATSRRPSPHHPHQGGTSST